MPSVAAARAGFVHALFPVPQRATRGLPARRVAIGALMVAVVAAIQLLRLPGDASTNTVWAEDGTVFQHDARTAGLGAIFHTYNGYVHLVPRLIAAVVAVFPLTLTAALLAVLSALVVGAVTLVVFVAARSHIPSPWWRLGLCATIVFMPVAGVELLDNTANLQWYLIAGAIWALLWRPQNVAAKTGQFVLCFLAAASDPLAAVLLPLAVGRIVASRSPRDHAPTAGLLAGLLLQLLIGTASPHSATQPGLSLLGRLYAQRVLLPLFAGDRGSKSLYVHFGWTPAYVAAAVAVAAICIWTAIRWRRGAAWLVLAFGLTSVVMFVIPVALRWDQGFVPKSGTADQLSTASRYMLVPLFALWSLAACALGSVRFGIARRPLGLAVAVAAVGVAATVFALDFSAPHGLRAGAARWSVELAAARATCLRTPEPATAHVAITPPSWAVELPCREVIATGP